MKPEALDLRAARASGGRRTAGYETTVDVASP
jgi:hypothetical protein